MSAVDAQLMVKDESTYGTAVTVDRTFEFNSESITESFMRTEGDPLRKGNWFQRSDRHTPYFGGASGDIEMDVLTKGFGFWLKHMLGGVSTGTISDSVYTHAGRVADLYGDSFTCQVGRPRHPGGTVQPFTYAGGKITNWELANSVDGNLVATLGCDFQQVATGTALATAAYPTSMQPLTWAGGEVTVGGVQFALDEITLACDNGLNVERRKIDGGTNKKEPTGGRRQGTFSLAADFEDITGLRAFAAALTAAGNIATIQAGWTGPVLAGVSSYPALVVAAVCRFDEWEANADSPEGIQQTLSGVFRTDGTDALDIDYVSVDATP